MPLYEYKCRDCSHRFERVHSYRARAPRCPDCGGRSERQLSAPAIQFKGSGFYITDYARKDRGDPAEASGKDDKSSKKDKAGTTDKKEPGGDKTASGDSAKKNGKASTSSTGKGGGSSSDS